MTHKRYYSVAHNVITSITGKTIEMFNIGKIKFIFAEKFEKKVWDSIAYFQPFVRYLSDMLQLPKK